MLFAQPQVLWLLLVPAVLLVRDLARRARNTAHPHPKILSAEAHANALRLSEEVTTEPQRGPRKIKGAATPLLCCGLALGIVALARPQYGAREDTVFEQSREVLIALDLSRSMLAEDIKPSRLARAKLLISGLFERLAGERVGLIVFSGTAFLQSPLSSDYEILRDFLPALGPDTLPEGGTNYRALLDTALDAFSDTPATDRFLIVLSDGEATDDTWERSLASLKKRDIRAITLGIGSPSGALIPEATGSAGGTGAAGGTSEVGGFVKDERGAVVLSKLEPTTLRALAAETGGLYRDASTWLDLAALISETVDQGAQGKFTDTRTQRLIDRYQWALAPALALLCLSFWLEFPVRPRPRALSLQAAKNAAARTARSTTASLLLLSTLLLYNTVNAQTPTAEPETSALGKIVARLADKPSLPSGRDWAELARETVTWGQKLQTQQHPVPPGPVHDALHATTLGEALDPETADWPQLRRELEALLETPPSPDEPEKPESQEQAKPQQNQNGDSQDSGSGKDSQQNQDDSQDGQEKAAPDSSNSDKSGKADPQQSDHNSDEPSPQPQDDNGSGSNEDAQKNKPANSEALGDMGEAAPQPEPENKAAPSPQHNGQTQQVGGTQPQSPASETDNPALTAALQKLEQIKGGDSPAQLFQLMDDTPRDGSANASKKNW